MPLTCHFIFNYGNTECQSRETNPVVLRQSRTPYHVIYSTANRLFGKYQADHLFFPQHFLVPLIDFSLDRSGNMDHLKQNLVYGDPNTRPPRLW